jgi:CcmD family protein
MDNWEYLVAAYSVVWIAIFGYVLVLHRRQNRLWREIESLKARVKGRGED